MVCRRSILFAQLGPNANLCSGSSRNNCQAGSGFECWSRSTSKTYTRFVAMHSFIGLPSYSGSTSLPMRTTLGMVCFTLFVRLVPSKLVFIRSTIPWLTLRQVLRSTIHKQSASFFVLEDSLRWQRLGKESFVSALCQPRHNLRPESDGM